MDNMIFTSEVCGVVLIAPFDKISRPPCSTIRFIVFLSLFFRCFSPFSFYHRTFSLTTESVMDEILLSLDNSDEEKAVHEAESIMESLHISEFRDAHPMSLSGGQKQRVAIASAIASDKQVIVFDEPTSGLDYRHMKKVAENLRELSSLGKTLFIVTHDPELIAECCNYFVFIENGKVLWSDGWNRISRERLQRFFAFEGD